jgi:hypothetical protein
MVTEAGLISPAEQSLQLLRHNSGWRAKAEILRLTISEQRLGSIQQWRKPAFLLFRSFDRSALGLVGRAYSNEHISKMATQLISCVFSFLSLN